VDAVARAVVSGERGLGEVEDALADDLASLMINRLAATGVPGYHRVAHLTWDAPDRSRRLEDRYGREALQRLIRRVGKHLDHAAMAAVLRGES
jgi:hypothetical protein